MNKYIIMCPMWKIDHNKLIDINLNKVIIFADCTLEILESWIHIQYEYIKNLTKNDLYIIYKFLYEKLDDIEMNNLNLLVENAPSLRFTISINNISLSINDLKFLYSYNNNYYLFNIKYHTYNHVYNYTKTIYNLYNKDTCKHYVGVITTILNRFNNKEIKIYPLIYVNNYKRYKLSTIENKLDSWLYRQVSYYCSLDSTYIKVINKFINDKLTESEIKKFKRIINNSPKFFYDLKMDNGRIYKKYESLFYYEYSRNNPKILFITIKDLELFNNEKDFNDFYKNINNINDNLTVTKMNYIGYKAT